MGYAFYLGTAIDAKGEFQIDVPKGYGVVATCDRRGCGEEIDRGLGYLCGGEPHGPFDDADGCGRYFCGKHLTGVGPRGGCAHRGKRAWGRTLACMDGDGHERPFCLYRIGHAGAHAWEVEPDVAG